MEDKLEIMESLIRVTPMPIKSGEMVFLCNCGVAHQNYACEHLGLSMLWNPDMKLPDVERAEQLKVKQIKKASNLFAAIAKRNKKEISISPQQRTTPRSYGNQCSQHTLFLWQTAVPPWLQRVAAWNQQRLHFLINTPSASIDWLLLCSQDYPSAISTANLIVCSRQWIPSFLFLREARVLLDVVTFRRTCLLEEG